jgi:hypothetical protein
VRLDGSGDGLGAADGGEPGAARYDRLGALGHAPVESLRLLPQRLGRLVHDELLYPRQLGVIDVRRELGQVLRVQLPGHLNQVEVLALLGDEADLLAVVD